MEGKPGKAGLKAPCTRGSPGAGLLGRRQLRPYVSLPAIWGHLVLQPLPFLPIYQPPILTPGVLCCVLLGTFPGTSAGLSPAARKAHAQGCAPGSAPFSQKLGSWSEPCSSSGSLTLQRASRASTVQQATRGTAGGWEGRRAAQQAQEREDVRKEWRGTTLAAPSSPWAGTRGGQTGRLTASAGLWVWDTARAGTRGTCCWWSPWTVSGGWAQLHPSAASCPPLSGVKFQPRRHRILGWGPSTPRPAPPFRAHLAIPPSGIWSPWLH